MRDTLGFFETSRRLSLSDWIMLEELEAGREFDATVPRREA